MRCVYCHDSGELTIVCRCRAVYHEACAVELLRCATIGCSATFKAAAKPRWKWMDAWVSLIDSIRKAGRDPRPKPEPKPKPNVFDRIDRARENPTLKNLGDLW